MKESNSEDEQPSGFDWTTRPEVDAAIDELEDSSPRAAAVLGGALLEDILDRLLAAALPDDSQARLESGEIDYFKKGHWALRMGLISRFEFRELRILGRIRNQFAHTWSAALDFGSFRIKDWVRSLETPDHLIQSVDGSGGHLIPLGDVSAYTKESERHRWLIAVTQMMIRLLGRIEATHKFSIPSDDHSAS